ncbi:MAG: hypothetical protein Q9222_004164 [Ikaeria aurantiellina]
MGLWIVAQIERYGSHGALTHPLFFRRNTVYFRVWPRQGMMTRLLFADVLQGMGDVVADEGWVYSSHVTVTERVKGLVGEMGMSYIPVGDGSAEDEGGNGSLVTNHIRRPGGAPAAGSISDGGLDVGGGAVAGNRRPDDPLLTQMANGKWLLLNNFGGDVPSQDLLALFLEVQLAAVRWIVEKGPTSRVRAPERWISGKTELELVPFTARWADVVYLAEELANELLVYAGFEFDFEVLRDGARGRFYIARGSLRFVA